MANAVAQAMDAQRFQRVAKALADPRRFEILERIAAAGPELACRSLNECFPVSQATISHHLKELTGAGLVEARREGQYVFYRTCPRVMRDYVAELERRLASVVREAS